MEITVMHICIVILFFVIAVMGWYFLKTWGLF